MPLTLVSPVPETAVPGASDERVEIGNVSAWCGQSCGLSEPQLHAQRLPQPAHLSADDRLLVCGTPDHWRTAALIAQADALGVQVIALEPFCPRTALHWLEREQITCSDWLPWQLSGVFDLQTELGGTAEAPGEGAAIGRAHQQAWVGGARTPAAVKQTAIASWGPILHEHFCGLDWPGFCEIDSPAVLEHPDSVGLWHQADNEPGDEPVNTSAALVVLNDAGEVLTVEQIGRFAVVARGSEPLLTSAVGYLDADGRAFPLGAANNRLAIQFGRGEQGVVVAGEAELWLETHPAVQEAALLAIDEDMGASMGLPACFYAVVQLGAGAGTATPLLEIELLQYARQGLSDIKCAAAVLFTAKLPRLPSGAVDLAALGVLVAQSMVVAPPEFAGS